MLKFGSINLIYGRRRQYDVKELVSFVDGSYLSMRFFCLGAPGGIFFPLCNRSLIRGAYVFFCSHISWDGFRFRNFIVLAILVILHN